MALRTEGRDDVTVILPVKVKSVSSSPLGPGRALTTTRRALNQLFCVRQVNSQNRRHALPVFLASAEASAIAPPLSSLSMLFFTRPGI